MRVPEADVISRYLADLDKRRRMQAWSAVAGGGLLSLFGPLVVTIVYEIKTSLDRDPARFGFWGTFLLICVITLPIFFLLARMVEGSLLEKYADATSDAWAFRMTRGRGAVMVLVLDIANIGPRLVIWGINRIDGMQRTQLTNPDRAVTAIATLLGQDQGIAPVKLLLPREAPEELEPLLAFLLHFQLIDIAKRGDRVWLTSTTRQHLIGPRST